ncbi:hypothetical protein CSW10_01625 [Mesomycoplasma dispar]|uniref:Uncharacterized protein n=1 Tax=Mesomycoplasma dispar TaxID=86660 RepID=A0ABM6PRF1_9BACT|nr:hypothetical protein CSW10_01625 [Mesomycoplasma dispar]
MFLFYNSENRGLFGIFGIPKEKQRKKLVKKLKSTNIDKNFKIKILVPKSSACFSEKKEAKIKLWHWHWRQSAWNFR